MQLRLKIEKVRLIRLNFSADWRDDAVWIACWNDVVRSSTDRVSFARLAPARQRVGHDAAVNAACDQRDVPARVYRALGSILPVPCG